METWRTILVLLSLFVSPWNALDQCINKQYNCAYQGSHSCIGRQMPNKPDDVDDIFSLSPDARRLLCTKLHENVDTLTITTNSTVSVSGKQCRAWNEVDPVWANFFVLGDRRCRNIPKDTEKLAEAPFCYVEDGLKEGAWEYCYKACITVDTDPCVIERKNGTEKCSRTASPNCILNKNAILSENKLGNLQRLETLKALWDGIYDGTKNTTKEGHDCLFWNNGITNYFWYKIFKLDHNLCRVYPSPNGHKMMTGPWCIANTTDSDKLKPCFYGCDSDVFKYFGKGYCSRIDAITFNEDCETWWSEVSKMTPEEKEYLLLVSHGLMCDEDRLDDDKCDGDFLQKLLSLLEKPERTRIEKIIVTAARTLGSIFVIGFTGAAFTLNLIFAPMNVHRIILVCEEICLIGCHLLILFTVDEKEGTEGFFMNNEMLCSVLAVMSHYFFAAFSMFQILEACQAYVIAANIQSRGSFISKQSNLLLGWGLPAVFVMNIWLFQADEYPSKNSCWVNYGSTNHSRILIAHMVISHVLAFLVIDFSTTSPIPKLKNADPEQMRCARISQVGLYVLIPLQIISWLTGSMAAETLEVKYFAIGFPVNITIAVYIFLNHTSSLPKVQKLLGKFFGRFYCCPVKET